MKQVSNADAHLIRRILEAYGAQGTPADGLTVVNLRRRARLLLKKLERNDRN